MEEFNEDFVDGEEYVVQPYMFEPEPPLDSLDSSSNEDDSGNKSDQDDHIDDPFHDRLGHLDWCDCSYCGEMSSGIECRCCHEFIDLEEKMDGFTCITQHPGFVANCLNKDVIEVSFYEFLQSNGPIGDDDPIHETYRYIAYRRLARWIWHRLSKYDRRVLPACAVTAIRLVYPSEQYSGFKYPRNL